MKSNTFDERDFPLAHPVISGLDYYGDRRPARGGNGNYIEYFEMNKGNLGLAVGDVSGKGVPTTLLKSSLHRMIRALRMARDFSLKTLVRKADTLFCEIGREKCFATLFVGEYDPTSGRLRYVNAGHEPPFVLRRNGEHFQTAFLESGGPMIGMQRESAQREDVVSLNPGDVLIAYTDGLCDIANDSGETWGWHRFIKRVEECADLRARGIVEGVMQTAEAFAQGTPLRDDATLFVGRVRDAVAATPLAKGECVLAAA